LKRRAIFKCPSGTNRHIRWELDAALPASKGKWRSRVQAFLALLLSLLASSCSDVKELQPVIARASYIPTGPEDFSFVDPIAEGKRYSSSEKRRITKCRFTTL
jgi:hypothetical protein